MGKILNTYVLADGESYQITIDEDALNLLVQECVNSLARSKPNKFPANCKVMVRPGSSGIWIKVSGEIKDPDGKIFDLVITTDIPWTKIAEKVYLKRYAAEDIDFPLEISQESRIDLQKLIILSIWNEAERKLERNLWDDIFWGLTDKK